MTLKHLVIFSILSCSSLALADDNARMWTIHAADNHAENSKDPKAVSDPGVFVTAQRDPHAKK